jgi:hypothetical protein
MRRDLDLIRMILIHCRDGKGGEPVGAFDDEAVRYHKALLIRAELAEGKEAKDFTRSTRYSRRCRNH